jgi:hypothetical protein
MANKKPQFIDDEEQLASIGEELDFKCKFSYYDMALNPECWIGTRLIACSGTKTERRMCPYWSRER